MKSVFPLLLCYVFTTAQTFAISGGPVFGGGTVSTTGIYAGVIQGVEETDFQSGGGPAIPGDPVTPGDTVAGTPSNALGLFSLTVPTTLLATGAFMLFADGEIFTGTINASVDPDNGQLKGLLSGTFNFTLSVFGSTGTVTSTQVTATAIGRINAKISSSNNFAANTLARLNGTANLDVGFGEVDSSTLQPIVSRSITFNVSGYKQASAAS